MSSVVNGTGAASNGTGSAREESDHCFKVLLIGDSGVGKSCLLHRFAENSFTQSFINTVGIDFKIRTINVGSKTVKLHVWDTAGQERFRGVSCNFYRGAHGIIVVYDITDVLSFDHVKKWLYDIDQHASEGACRILVGNKCDLTERRAVSYESGQQLARKLGVGFLEASAKDDRNVENIFLMLSDEIIQRTAKLADNYRSGNGGNIRLEATKAGKKGTKGQKVHKQKSTSACCK